MKQELSNGPHNKRVKTISVAVPAFNEGRTISQLLQCILEQSNAGLVVKEIVVNASGSTDDTNARVQATMLTDARIKLIDGKEREGKAAALNSILREVNADVVVFIDGDVILERQAISTLVNPLLLNEAIGICSGNTMPVKAEAGFFEFASFFTRSLHHELCACLTARGLTPKVNGTFFAVRRNILDAFPLTVVSDDEYASWRAQKLGYRIVYVPDAMVYTKDPYTFGDFLRWQKRILAGQMYIKRHFDYQVPTMRAYVVVPSLLRLLSQHKRKLLSLLALFSLATLSYLLAFITYLRNEIPYAY